MARPRTFTGKLAHYLRGRCEISGDHFVYPRAEPTVVLAIAPLTDLIEELIAELEDEHHCTEASAYRERLDALVAPDAEAEPAVAAEAVS